jgi:hypothetical protein
MELQISPIVGLRRVAPSAATLGPDERKETK